MTGPIVYVDADDFHARNSGDGLLERIHDANPAFRITLFAIPSLCPPAFLAHWLSVPWVRLVPHGWTHETSRECEAWTYQQARQCFDRCARLGLSGGWKSPGWQSSMGVLHALRDRGWWLAGQHYDDGRHPEGLRVYYPDGPGARHYHLCGEATREQPNDIRIHADELAAMKEAEFGFIGD